MAKIKYDRWLSVNDLNTKNNFKDEKLTFCYAGHITSIYSEFFGRCEKFRGYITSPPYHHYFFQAGEHHWNPSESCIIIGEKEDSILITSHYSHFKLDRRIKRTHFEPPKDYWGKVDKKLLSWAKLFDSKEIRKIYGISNVIVVDSLFAKQFKIKQKAKPATQRLVKKIKLHLEL